MKNTNDQRPGELFVDRYMPNASAEDREAAYQNVRQLIAVLVRINDRLVREDRERDSQESEVGGRVRGPGAAPVL